MKNSSSPISHFASTVLGKPLYPYQAEVANAILTSVLFGQGRIFTVMMARQSGKNQLSALQAFTALATSTLVHLVRFYVDEGLALFFAEKARYPRSYKLEDVVSVTRYIRDVDVNQDAINRVGAFFGTHRPTSVTVEVVRMATDPRIKVEMSAVAVAGE